MDTGARRGERILPTFGSRRALRRRREIRAPATIPVGEILLRHEDYIGALVLTTSSVVECSAVLDPLPTAAASVAPEIYDRAQGLIETAVSILEGDRSCWELKLNLQNVAHRLGEMRRAASRNALITVLPNDAGTPASHGVAGRLDA